MVGIFEANSQETRLKARKKKIVWTEELFQDKVIKPISEGRSVTDIAKDFGLSRQSIIRRLNINGFKNKSEVLIHLMQVSKEG